LLWAVWLKLTELARDVALIVTLEQAMQVTTVIAVLIAICRVLLTLVCIAPKKFPWWC
jgi:hypothetical protein